MQLAWWHHRRYAERFREVTNVLARHGFGLVFDRYSLTAYRRRRKQEQEFALLSAPQRLRMALEQLGPTFVKLGQLVSTRPDLIPLPYIIELEKLQDDVVPFTFEVVLQVLKEEGIDPDSFSHLEPVPLAAASIGQVHRAVLQNGEEVVLKIQRPGVRRIVETDLQILNRLAVQMGKRTAWGRLYQPQAILQEFASALLGELDYAQEGENAETFYNNFKNNTGVIIPRVYWEYTAPRVLTMQYVSGIKVSNMAALQKSGYDLKKVATNMVEALFSQYYDHGFFHADPHPGNLAVAPGEKIIFYDFGQVGVVDQYIKEQTVELVLAMTRYDAAGVMRTLINIGSSGAPINREELRRDISRLQRKYYGMPMARINLGEAISELIEVSMKHQIRVPAELSLVAKMGMTVEGLITRLDPNLSIVEIAKPLARRVVMGRLNPSRLGDDLRDLFMDSVRLLNEFPRQANSLLGQLEEGDLKIRLEHSNLRRFINTMDIIANRISLAIITGSIIMGTSLLVRQGHTVSWHGISPVVVGFSFAVVLGMFLIYSIIRSGRY
ncbi:MAG: ABC1 kinase family protein [Methylocystaceae bacterium]